MGNPKKGKDHGVKCKSNPVSTPTQDGEDKIKRPRGRSRWRLSMERDVNNQESQQSGTKKLTQSAQKQLANTPKLKSPKLNNSKHGNEQRIPKKTTLMAKNKGRTKRS